ncbi:hypothetical protein GCM10009757_27480 [Streptomyces cheonanensis]|uniref:Uncharacterized protein n=1 Tax=Streptomyces cheonanensis TaxID=312720 RepID=A0ABN2V6L5_9ACTN
MIRRRTAGASRPLRRRPARPAAPPASGARCPIRAGAAGTGPPPLASLPAWAVPGGHGGRGGPARRPPPPGRARPALPFGRVECARVFTGPSPRLPPLCPPGPTGR